MGCENKSISYGDVHVSKALAAKQFIWPPDTVEDINVQPYANIAASKRNHQFSPGFAIADATSVSSMSVPVMFMKRAGTAEKLVIAPITAPTGGDLQYTVDLQKGNAASAFASILSAPITVDSSATSLAMLTAVPTSKTLVAGDLLQIVVTASGTTGSQGLGLVAQAKVREKGQ